MTGSLSFTLPHLTPQHSNPLKFYLLLFVVADLKKICNITSIMFTLFINVFS